MYKLIDPIEPAYKAAVLHIQLIQRNRDAMLDFRYLWERMQTPEGPIIDGDIALLKKAYDRACGALNKAYKHKVAWYALGLAAKRLMERCGHRAYDSTTI